MQRSFGISLFIIFCFITLINCQDKCEFTEITQTSFQLISCTYVATHNLFFVKIDLLTTENQVIANYWNSKITRKDYFIPITIANQFINAG